MKIISIDPGVKHIGWASHVEGKLSHCGLSKKWVNLAGDIIVIEKPQIYSPRFWKGDPNDLINIAIVVGEIKGIYEKLGGKVVLVLPNQWKGQTPKDVIKNQIDKDLDKRETEVMKNALQNHPKHLHHNIYDAVGIGRWYARTH